MLIKKTYYLLLLSSILFAQPRQYQLLENANPAHNRCEAAKADGTINTVVLFIKFQNDPDFSQARSVYDADFNSTTGNSVKYYYREVSYNNIEINGFLYPQCAPTVNLAYTFPKPRGYFQDYSSSNTIGYKDPREGRLREHEIIDSLLLAIRQQVPADLNLDFNNDGFVDNVMIIFQGSPGPWNDLGLWPHSGVLDTYDTRINGKRVYHYSIHLETMAEVGTFCHETFHVLGAPDLYRYFVSATPVGAWDIMASGSGHMGAFMKYKYTGRKWIKTMPVITKSGTYRLSPLTSDTNNCYRINSPYTNDEYFVLEYRNKTGFYESTLPGSGLLVYRINTKAGDGNGGGPPDEVYLFRKGGTVTTGGSSSQAYYSTAAGRTAINDYNTDPKSFLSTGAKAGLDIRNIGSAGATISFDVLIVDCAITQPPADSVLSVGSTLSVKARAADSAMISKVEFYVNGALAGTDAAYPYEYQWNTTGLQTGQYSLKARAISTTGVYKDDSVKVYLTGVNPVALVSGIKDSAKVSIGDSLKIEAKPYGSVSGVASVKFYIDGILKSSVTAAPYYLNWVVQSIGGGKHTLRVLVTDSLGNQGYSDFSFFVIKYLLNEGFENSWPPDGWSVNSMVYGWYQSPKGAHLGVKCAATRNYHPSGPATLETPQFVPDSTCSLEFYWMDNSLDITKLISGHDTTYCEISVAGAPYTVLRYLSAADVEPEYHRESIDLKPYAGKSVKIRWRDVADESMEAMGTALDDIKIVAYPGPYVGVEGKAAVSGPGTIELNQNYPNPFNPETRITFYLDKRDMVSLSVYNLLGGKVAELLNEALEAGSHQVTFNASRLASGVYFYRLRTTAGIITRKLILQK